MPSKTSMKRKPEDVEVEPESEEDSFGVSEPMIDDTVPAKRQLQEGESVHCCDQIG